MNDPVRPNSISKIAVVGILILLPVIPCSAKNFPGLAVPFERANILPQSIIEVRLQAFPNMNVDTNSSKVFISPLDKDSIEQFVTAQKDTVYHPVSMCHRAFQFIGTYVKNGDTLALRRAEQYATKLRELSHFHDGALFVAYHFDYKLHMKPELQLSAPFYSGMAQGEMLSVMTRLHHLTGKPEYLEWARQTFESLFRTQPLDTPWVSRIDTAGYFWIEEYLISHGMDQTLNGFIAALYGVYDYAILVKDPRAKELWDASLTTLKRYLPEFRRTGKTSYYCIGHLFPATEDYHRLHISMCRELYRVTNDQFFLEAARGFNTDLQVTEPF